MADESWIFQPWFINRWLETALGFPPWFIIIVIDPILVILAVFLLREICLRVLFLFEGPMARNEGWRRASSYLATLLSIVGVGAVWRIRMGSLSGSLETVLEGTVEESEPFLIGAVYAVVTTLIVVFLLFLLQLSFRAAVGRLDKWSKTARAIQFQKAVILRPRKLFLTAVLFLRVARLLVLLGLLYIYIPLLLSYFPVTAPFADTIMPYVTSPLRQLGAAIIGYIPKFITLILIVVAMRFLMRSARFVADALEKEQIQWPGFEPDWADPTYKLVRSLILIVGLMMSYNYLPGAESEVFAGFSIFVGALVTLGARGAIDHIISGIVLTYTRAFRVGDRVRIGDTIGDILEKRLFVTRLKTLENEEITMPNGVVLGAQVINLSVRAETEGLALQVSAGIGYDVDWRQVHELMKKAATRTPDVLADPQPFVLEIELDDYAVQYTLFAYTDNPKRARLTRAALRRNMLDAFNKEGIEIMTPSVAALRDGNVPAIPQDYGPAPGPVPGIQILTHPAGS